MGARRRRDEAGQGQETRRVVVRKRRPRPGPRRHINLSIPADLAVRLEVHAVRHLTTVSEIVADWIEANTGRRGRGGEADAEATDSAA